MEYNDRIIRIQEILHIKSQNKKKVFLNIDEVNEILDILKAFRVSINVDDDKQNTISKHNFDKVLKEKEILNNTINQLVNENITLKRRISEYNIYAKKEIEDIKSKIQKLYIE